MGDAHPLSPKKLRNSKNGGSAGILLPDLRRKISRLKYALDMRNNEEFAFAIGERKPSTLSDYFRARGAYAKNAVPPDALSDMAALLRRALGNTVTLKGARTLWCGPLVDFQVAFEKAERSGFRALLPTGQRVKILTMVRHKRPLTLRVIDFLDDDPADDHTKVGDMFHFDCAGPPGHWIVLLVEDEGGMQIGWPRDNNEPAKFAADGTIRVPASEHMWKFKEPGLHRFIAFAIDSEKPPGLSEIGKRLSRLEGRELDDFAADLKDFRRVRSWALEIFVVCVLGAERQQ